MPGQILVVDDDEQQRRVLTLLLEKEGFRVVTADRGDRAFTLAAQSPPDLVISDVAMPVEGGVSLCHRLRHDRRTARVPVLLMSGQHKDADDQAAGIEKGADDYLLKPITPRLLRAKVAAVLRRYEAPKELKDVLRLNGLLLDVAARTVEVKGQPVALTRKEFDLLTLFLRKARHVLRPTYLLEAVWGYDPADYNDTATVQVHISNLRKKLGASFAKKLVSLPGVGYRFDA